MKADSKKPIYITWQNIVYLIKGTWAAEKLMFLYFGGYTVLTAVTPFIGILFPRLILGELMGAKRADQLILYLVAFFVCGGGIGYLTTWLQNVYFPRMIKVRFTYMRLHELKCMTTDYRNTENPQFLNDMETAFRGLQSNNTGIEGVLHKLFSLAGSLLAMAGYIAIVATLNVYVLLYLLANVIISYYLTYSVRKYEHDQKDEISENDRRSGYLYQIMYDFAYGKELRLFGMTDWIADRFRHYKQLRLQTHAKIRWRFFRAGLVDVFLLLIREGVVYAYLIYLVVAGRLSIPDFTLYFATIAGFAGWFTQMMNDMAHIRAQNLDICDYRRFIEAADNSTQTDTMPLPPAPYTFEFKDVSFHYPNSDTDIFKHLNLTIPAGQKCAIVGHNGAGKTTFIKLLCRLYDVSEGSILLNGIDIRRFDQTAYFELFSAVFQEVKPLAFSIAENVALVENGQIDQARLNLALSQAGIADKVKSLANGPATSMLKILDDQGVEFSGGENQKIAIARALYKNGSIMVLDEPTAALDALAEHAIYLRFNEMVRNKTAVYISHRLASTHFCDVIAMFEQGELVEYGSHDKLMARNGKYADMFAVQAEYYKEDQTEDDKEDQTEDDREDQAESDLEEAVAV